MVEHFIKTNCIDKILTYTVQSKNTNNEIKIVGIKRLSTWFEFDDIWLCFVSGCVCV